MADGNGTDLNTIVAMLSQVLSKLMVLEQSVGVLKQDTAAVKQDVGSLTSKLEFYHSSVMGHGIMLTELDQRLRRVEHQLGLPPLPGH